jgi:predicted TIM-barrel enzyme
VNILEEMFGVKKPIIGMVHFPPLPGSPLYDSGGGMKKIMDITLRDTEALLEAGFDGVSFSNEGDRPYMSNVSKVTVAAMSALITEAKKVVDRPLDFPFWQIPKRRFLSGQRLKPIS